MEAVIMLVLNGRLKMVTSVMEIQNHLLKGVRNMSDNWILTTPVCVEIN